MVTSSDCFKEHDRTVDNGSGKEKKKSYQNQSVPSKHSIGSLK